jgi:ADP-dependent NAD(P)H-hydrate dehydratase / NAD(P)H-hydrate epimerase
MRVFTAEQMRMLDRLTVERAHVSFARLMEAAGEQVVEAIYSRFGPVKGKRCLVFCGKGNNGGDGAVIGRLLQARGAKVAITLLADVSETRGEAAANFASWSSMHFSEQVSNALPRANTQPRSQP